MGRTPRQAAEASLPPATRHGQPARTLTLPSRGRAAALLLASRAVWIRGILGRHLKKVVRSPLTLYLLYATEAASDVCEMVRKQECCAFLHFDLSVDDDVVHLLITAPEAAREAADMLFDHFAPELAPVAAA